MSERGYGWITPHNGAPDVFFHARALVPPLWFDDGLLLNQNVELEVEVTERGPRATFVRQINAGAK
jgi:cold shock CspA family protein